MSPTAAPAWQMIAFDFDGTLADSFPVFVRIHNQLASRHGFARIEADAVPALRELDMPALLRYLRVPRWRLPLLAWQARKLFRGHADGVGLFPGVVEALGRLHASGTRLALLTSNGEASVRACLGPAWSLFETQRCGVSLEGKARRLRQLARRSGIGPGQLLYVGDQLSDGRAARKAGCGFAAVGWGYASPVALQRLQPDYLLRKPDELPGLAGPAAMGR